MLHETESQVGDLSAIKQAGIQRSAWQKGNKYRQRMTQESPSITKNKTKVGNASVVSGFTRLRGRSDDISSCLKASLETVDHVKYAATWAFLEQNTFLSKIQFNMWHCNSAIHI